MTDSNSGATSTAPFNGAACARGWWSGEAISVPRSRHIFVRFYTGDAMPNFLRGHVDAFNFFDSVPREILYDNLRSAVLERYGSAIRFNPQLLDLAAHYHFQPKPTGVRKPQQKGRMERAIANNSLWGCKFGN